MGSWRVILRGEKGNVTFDFADTTNITQQLLRLSLIDKLLENARAYNNYRLSMAIESITSPDGEDMTNRQMYVLLAKSKQYGVSLGYLLGELDIEGESALAIVGLWPSEFVDLLQRNEEYYLKALASIIMEPDAWESVDLVIPE
ncbi:MAG: hypothetical protein J7L11_06610 [Thermoprotei archaeon]|nr:hypothetical protein [Thermoprotei archaeon]